MLVSTPVAFGLEARAFVCERKLCALSAYMRDGEIARTADGDWPMAAEERAAATRFLEAMLADADVALPPAVVIDVGALGPEAVDGRVVVEANPAWASGVCGCDPGGVLETIARACVAAGDVQAEDEAWLRSRHRRTRAP